MKARFVVVGLFTFYSDEDAGLSEGGLTDVHGSSCKVKRGSAQGQLPSHAAGSFCSTVYQTLKSMLVIFMYPL